MRETKTALIVVCAAAMVANTAANAFDTSRAEVKGESLNLSRELRPFPRGPIIVNTKKPESNEKTVASNDVGRDDAPACPGVSQKTEKDKSCFEVRRKNLPPPAS